MCLGIVCTNQIAPDNGKVTCDNRENLNSNCTFSCDVGYRLDGNHTRTCIDDNNGDALGMWTDETPTCTGESYFSVKLLSTIVRVYNLAFTKSN